MQASQGATAPPASSGAQRPPDGSPTEPAAARAGSSNSAAGADGSLPNAQSIVSLASTAVLNEKHSASRLGLPLGAVVTPLPDLRVPLPVVKRLPVACPSCCAVINAHCKVDPRTGTWACIFCGHESSDQGLLGGMMQELRSEAVDYVTPPAPDERPLAPVVALAIDAAASPADLEALKAAALQVLGKLPRRTRLLLLGFAEAVSVFHLGSSSSGSDVVGVDVFPGHDIPQPPVLEALTQSAREAGCLAHMHACRPAAEAAVQSLRPLTAEPRRCLGAAMHAAVHLVRALGPVAEAGPQSQPDSQGMSRSAAPPPPSRVLVITTGAATKGPGAAGGQGPDARRASAFFGQLAQLASDGSVAVDVLAVGVEAAAVPLLDRTARETGGLLLLHKGFGPLLAANAAAAAVRRIGECGFMDLHATRGLEVTRLIGAVAAPDRGPRGLLARRSSGFVTGAGAVELGAIERGHAVGVCLDVTATLEQPDVFLQVVVSWTAEDGSSVHRVVTRRLQVCRSRADALRATDAETGALLLAKRIVQEALLSDAADSPKEAERLRAAIAKHLAHVAGALGEAHELPGGWLVKRKRWSLPPSLRFLSEALYQLQRGPLLGPAPLPPEERVLLQRLFVHAAPAVALRMLAPALHLLDRASGQFNQVIAADIALWSDSAAVVDYGSRLLVWLGKQLPAAMPDPSGDGRWTRSTVVCERFAAKLTAGRFPVPELVSVTEGAPQAAQEAAALIPLRQDSPEEQEEQLAVLAFLTEEQLAGLLSRQAPTQEPSLLQWTRAAGVEPPPPPDNVTAVLEGMALARANSIGIASMHRAQSLAERRRNQSLAAAKAQAGGRNAVSLAAH